MAPTFAAHETPAQARSEGTIITANANTITAGVYRRANASTNRSIRERLARASSINRPMRQRTGLRSVSDAKHQRSFAIERAGKHAIAN